MRKSASRPRSLRFVSVALGALVLSGTALTATSASVTIDTVGGQAVSGGKVKNPVSGAVTVAGRAGGLAGGDGSSEPAAKPLVADAGDSPFVGAGDAATLLGSGYGGVEPYTFRWSSPVGTLTGADAPTASLGTQGVPPGTYEVSLTVTDAAGATATDTVKVVVYAPRDTVILNQSRLDTTPGADGVGPDGRLEFAFDVPANTSKLRAKIAWTNSLNDYDLYVYDAKGNQAGAGEGQFVPDNDESAEIAAPSAGNGWKVVALKWLTTPPDTVTATVVATGSPADPRPAVTSGGPYRFAIGAEQTLSGTVSGGTAPVSAGWDTDNDGVVDKQGTSVTTSLPEGRHVVTFKAVDANGLERRETTSVLVADADRLAQDTTPITVVAINDTGINPYHLEFSADTYPDPEVLALTRNFTRHPSEYVPGYPADAPALPVTLGQGYFPAADKDLWQPKSDTNPKGIERNTVYWVPGTKIVGAIYTGGWTGQEINNHPILDENGHGTGSASVSVGNRYGYCPTCLLVVVEELNAAPAGNLDWVDFNSNSWGTRANAPLGYPSHLAGLDPAGPTRRAVERGQTVLFASGNGAANAFDVPIQTYGTPTTGPDWLVVVGAIRRDNQRAIVGDGMPVHISAWGDGNLPSGCRTGTVSQCAFGGTSAATPYTAGVFGHVLNEVRRAIGDTAAGQRPGQVVAEGFAVPESEYLADGTLTRAELREAVLKTAMSLNQENDLSSPYPYPATAPYSPANVLFEGYGAASPESAKRAIAVILGEALIPEREFEDAFFEIDRAIRDTLWGGYDRNGDGTAESEALAGLDITAAQVDSLEGTMAALNAAAEKSGVDLSAHTLGENALTFFLHRRYAGPEGTTPSCADNESYMDATDTSGDREPCYENRITSVAAAYRPLAMFPSTTTLDAPLPAGSTVAVQLYVSHDTPTVIRPKGVLMATDREIGAGESLPKPVLGSGGLAAGCAALGEACWTGYEFSFTTTRPAFTGEQLTFQVQLIGARNWAFGFEGAHASRITITPAPMPPSGLEFGVTIDEPANGSRVKTGDVVAGGRVTFPDLGSDPTGAGDHPTRERVDVSVDDPSFASPREAVVDHESGTWSIGLSGLSLGEHTLYVRAAVDRTNSEVASSTFTVVENAEVQWQIVSKNNAPKSDAWKLATGLQSWTFGFNTADYATGPNTIVVRLLEAGNETARTAASVKLK